MSINPPYYNYAKPWFLITWGLWPIGIDITIVAKFFPSFIKITKHPPPTHFLNSKESIGRGFIVFLLHNETSQKLYLNQLEKFQMERRKT